MGIITGDNIYYLTGNKPDKPQNGVFSFSVRGGSKAFQDYVLEESDYTDSIGNKANDDTDFSVIHFYATEVQGKVIRGGYNIGDTDLVYDLSTLNITVIDRNSGKNGNIYKGDETDIIDYVKGGNNCSTILVNARWQTPMALFVYK